MGRMICVTGKLCASPSKDCNSRIVMPKKALYLKMNSTKQVLTMLICR